MKVKVPLRDSTMEVSKHWLEIEGEGSDYRLSLRSDKGVVGTDEPIGVTRAFLENLAEVGAGVILRNEPLQFYKTEKDVRVSFTDVESEGEPAGFDRLDAKELEDAIEQVIGERESHRKESGTKKKAASKPRRRAKKANKRA